VRTTASPNDGGQMEVAHNNIYGFGEGITSGEGYFHDKLRA